MKKFFLFLLSTLVLTTFTACTESSENLKPTVSSNGKALPSWYKQTHENDKSYIYGLGMGDNRKVSVNNALNDAVATLNVSVASNYTQETSSTRHNTTEDYTQKSKENLEIITDKLSLNNYEVVEQQQLGNGSYVVMVRINKHQLYTSLHNELENSYKLLETNLQHKSDELDIILTYTRLLGKIREKMKTIGIMHTLNPAFDDASFKHQYKTLISTYNQLLVNKHFQLKLNDPYKSYTKHIQKGVVHDGFKLTTTDSYDYIIRDNIEEDEKIVVRRDVITFLTTTFSLGIGDKTSGNELFYTNFKLKSQSDESREKARELIIEQLTKKIESDGIFNITGI